MPEEEKYSEKRRFPRTVCDLSVEFTPENAAEGAPIRQERLTNIGEGGCFIQTRLTYPRDTRLNLSIILEGERFQALGAVRFAVPFVPEATTPQFPGMGIEFLRVDGAQVIRIRKFVTRERLKQGLGLTNPSSESPTK